MKKGVRQSKAHQILLSTLFRITRRNSIPRALALVASLGAIAAHAEIVIPATDPAVTAGLSPYNWQ